MTTDYRIFYIIDEFCKHFYAENAENLLEDNSEVRRRRRQASLSDSEIITILLFFFILVHSAISDRYTSHITLQVAIGFTLHLLDKLR